MEGSGEMDAREKNCEGKIHVQSVELPENVQIKLSLWLGTAVLVLFIYYL